MKEEEAEVKAAAEAAKAADKVRIAADEAAAKQKEEERLRVEAESREAFRARFQLPVVVQGVAVPPWAHFLRLGSINEVRRDRLNTMLIFAVINPHRSHLKVECDNSSSNLFD